MAAGRDAGWADVNSSGVAVTRYGACSVHSEDVHCYTSTSWARLQSNRLNTPHPLVGSSPTEAGGTGQVGNHHDDGNVASLVVFLVSAAGRNLSGQSLGVDGNLELLS